MQYQVSFTTTLDWQTAATWQKSDTPFMAFTFWQALVASNTIGEGTDWLVLFALVSQSQEQQDRLIAAMPVFVKQHHQGEYVFDQAWAEAYERYGQDYYPRLVTSVPFSPVTGERVWLTSGQQLTSELWQVLLQALDNLAKQLKASTWHGLFLPKSVVALANSQSLLRIGCQFLWHNRNLTGEKFADFNDFLSVLTAKKRKSIKVERQKVAEQGLTCRIKRGHDIREVDWQVFYQCYAMTYLVRGRRPYLPLAFFEQLGHTMAEQWLLIQAVDTNHHVVACALFAYDEQTLYGRYWGCLAEYDCLHFELCYYQGIAFAIAQGLATFDPGTQGEHKLIRGFVPELSYSLHQVYDARFAAAIGQYCKQERQAVLDYYADAMTAVPFNQTYLATLPQAALTEI